MGEREEEEVFRKVLIRLIRILRIRKDMAHEEGSHRFTLSPTLRFNKFNVLKFSFPSPSSDSTNLMYFRVFVDMTI